MRGNIFLLNLIVLFCYSGTSWGLPIRYELPLEIRVLQNPNLFGGDIMGINITSIGMRNAIKNDDLLWPSGVIPFTLAPDMERYSNIITSAMNQYHQNTCIRFKRRTNQYDYVHIINGQGCYSYIGRTGGKQIVSLGDGCVHMGTIVHELMHAVGFYHEHNRSDRDDYIKIYYNNIEPNREDQFVKLSLSEIKILGEFDYNSVMLYGPLTFSKDGKSITMAPKKSNIVIREVYEKYGLSSDDIKIIGKLYQCN